VITGQQAAAGARALAPGHQGNRGNDGKADETRLPVVTRRDVTREAGAAIPPGVRNHGGGSD